MTEETIKKTLATYVGLILKCETLLKKNYNLTSIPYLHKGDIPKNGVLQIDNSMLSYNFHGSGCTFMLGNIELSYDVYADRENYIVTSPWKFQQFVNSYLTEKITEAQIADYLELFDKKNIVKRVYPDYLVYAINFEWYYVNMS